MTADKHEVESRIEAAEEELVKAREALKRLDNTSVEEFSRYLDSMSLQEKYEITDVNERGFDGHLNQRFWFYGEKIPNHFYNRFTVHLTKPSNPDEGIFFQVRKRTGYE